jgi:hypothetical protein
MHISHYVVSISGFAHNQPVWHGQKLQIYKGPTVELTIVMPQDPARIFNVPFPVSRVRLRGLVAREGGLLRPKQLKLLHDSIDAFAKDVADNRSWYQPYRPSPEELAGGVVAVGAGQEKMATRNTGLEPSEDSWF